MMLLIMLLIVIIMILALSLVLYRREVGHLLRQLEAKERGSQAEFTTCVRNKHFLMLYRKLNNLFEAAQRKEQKYMQAQNQLKQTISNIAHDIRTPLTSAAGYLQMLTECTEQEKQLRYEHIIEKRIEELKEMLEELFLYTKLTSEEFQMECKSVAVFPVLSECMIELYQAFEEKNIEPDIHFADEEICVMASPESLGRIFRNLIHNALLHGTGGLRIMQIGTEFRFSNPVKDVTSVDTDQIFKRFYKADQSRQKGSSGLGLAIVKELTERMGGSVEAVVNENSELEITLRFQAVA